MPEPSPLLMQSTAADYARLHELLDGLFNGRAVEPAAGLPQALARLQGGVTDMGAEATLATDTAEGQLGTRAEATAVGLAGFGAASALLLHEQYGPVAPSASPNAALSSPVLRADMQLAADEVAPPTAVELALDTEADWVAAGAHDRALFQSLQDGGIAPDALPLALGLSTAAPGANADALTALDYAIARLDGQLVAVAADAALFDVAVPAAEVAAAVEALASQPLPTLMAQTRVAATAFQQEAEATAEVAGDDAVEALPELSGSVGLVDDLENALPDIVESVTGVLDQILTRAGDGALMPVGELVAGVGDTLDDLLGGIGATLDDVLAPVQSVIDPLVDVAGDVVGGVLDGVGDVLAGVGSMVGGATDTLDGLLDAVGAGLGQVGPVPTALDAVGDTLAGLGDLVESVLNPTAPPPVVPLVDAVAQLGETLPLQPLTDGLQDVLSLVSPAGGPNLEGDAPDLAGTLPSLGTQPGDASDALGQALNGLLKPGA